MGLCDRNRSGCRPWLGEAVVGSIWALRWLGLVVEALVACGGAEARVY